MRSSLAILFAILLLAVSTFSFFRVHRALAAASTIDATARISVCGNDVQEGGEQCDGSDFGGSTCTNMGRGTGTLTCTVACDIDATQCIPSSGGATHPQSISTTPPIPAPFAARFDGLAYPASEITLLEDGQVVTTTTADDQGVFSITVTDASNGTYLFALFARDGDGVRSGLFTIPLTLAGNPTIVDQIVLAPTLSADPLMMLPGSSLTLRGQTAPLSAVTVILSPTGSQWFMNANTAGWYGAIIPSNELPHGLFWFLATATSAGQQSGTSEAVFVSTNDIANPNQQNLPPPATGASSGDINEDNHINLLDFSVVAFWYLRQNPPATVDLNHDGVVDLVDFSILASQWTG